jgi:hypothetical protein
VGLLEWREAAVLLTWILWVCSQFILFVFNNYEFVFYQCTISIWMNGYRLFCQQKFIYSRNESIINNKRKRKKKYLSNWFRVANIINKLKISPI